MFNWMVSSVVMITRSFLFKREKKEKLFDGAIMEAFSFSFFFQKQFGFIRFLFPLNQIYLYRIHSSIRLSFSLECILYLQCVPFIYLLHFRSVILVISKMRERTTSGNHPSFVGVWVDHVCGLVEPNVKSSI